MKLAKNDQDASFLNFLCAGLALLFVCILCTRSLQFAYRTIKELSVPLYQPPKISQKICDIDPESVNIHDYHRFWYNRLGMNCKDSCEAR